jgi:hypothetical protein
MEEFWSSLIDPHTYVLCPAEQWTDLTRRGSPQKLGGTLNCVTILSPAAFAQWQQVVVMGARARKTLTYLIWQRMFRVAFVPHPLQAQLPAAHLNGSRLTIRYFWSERATRSMLKQRSTQGISMQHAMIASTADFFGNTRFIWSLPVDGEGAVKSGFWTKSSAFASRLRIPGRSHGLNSLRQYHNVALLSVINLPPAHFGLMEALGISDDEVTECFAFALLYQDLLRSSLRDPDATAPVTAIVPDLASALALQTELPAAGSRRWRSA